MNLKPHRFLGEWSTEASNTITSLETRRNTYVIIVSKAVNERLTASELYVAETLRAASRI